MLNDVVTITERGEILKAVSAAFGHRIEMVALKPAPDVAAVALNVFIGTAPAVAQIELVEDERWNGLSLGGGVRFYMS